MQLLVNFLQPPASCYFIRPTVGYAFVGTQFINTWYSSGARNQVSFQQKTTGKTLLLAV